MLKGGPNFIPSRIETRQNFPIEPAFAATVYKAEGRTILNVILALSRRSAAMCNMSYEALYVALSRVKTKDGIRLLLTGDSPWETLDYISALRPNKKVQAFFQGYVPANDDIQDGAMVWNADLAYQAYQDNN